MEKQPFEDIVRRHYPLIARAALVLSGDPWEAEDLAQEVFCAAQRNYGRFEDRAPVAAWLYGILRNVDRQRRAKLRPPPRPGRTRRHAPDPLAALMRDEIKAHLWTCLSRLSPKLREAVFLKYMEGLSQQAIAELTGERLGTVKSRIAAGLAELRQLLGPRERSTR